MKVLIIKIFRNNFFVCFHIAVLQSFAEKKRQAWMSFFPLKTAMGEHDQWNVVGR